jgi:hypothetical protein
LILVYAQKFCLHLHSCIYNTRYIRKLLRLHLLYSFFFRQVKSLVHHHYYLAHINPNWKLLYHPAITTPLLSFTSLNSKSELQVKHILPSFFLPLLVIHSFLPIEFVSLPITTILDFYYCSTAYYRNAFTLSPFYNLVQFL